MIAPPVELVDPGPLRDEITSLRTALTNVLGADPFGSAAMWRGTSCGLTDCPCGWPELPCEEHMGGPGTGPWCPRCSWNQAAHRLYRRRQVARWLHERPVVATVCRITDESSPRCGWWDVQVTGRRYPRAQTRDHAEAVRQADRWARAELARRERQAA